MLQSLLNVEIYIYKQKKRRYILLSAHDTFLEYPPSGTFKVK